MAESPRGFTKTSRTTPIERLLSPFQAFMHEQASGGIVLLICTIVALAWANIPAIAESYFSIWLVRLTVGLGDFVLDKPVFLWINDGLMAVFFFVVGLEIKRELLGGELSSFRQAVLPAAAALGGMVVPAVIYWVANAGGEGAGGWGVPMATDIAFALGVLALLGNRVPVSLRVFLTALAIVDDLGAVLVIAFFFTKEILWIPLAVALLCVALLISLNRLGVQRPVVYMMVGFVLWVAVLKSGVHATIAGVVLAMTIPSRPRLEAGDFAQHSRELVAEYDRAGAVGQELAPGQHEALRALANAADNAVPLLRRMELELHPWVAFFIMPLFALVNAGVIISADFRSLLVHPVSYGVAAGLILGKQLGITGFVWLAVRSRLAVLPTGTTWMHIYGAGWLGGIGFTMSLFIADLAFAGTTLLPAAKVGILGASIVSGLIGWALLRWLAPASGGNADKAE